MRKMREKTLIKKLEEAKRILKEKLPKRLFEVAREIDEDPKKVEELVDIILELKEKRKVPTLENFPQYLWYIGLEKIYEKICGDPNSELYLPIFDKNSKWYAPGLLVRGKIEETKEGMRRIILKETISRYAKKLEKDGKKPKPFEIIMEIKESMNSVYKLWKIEKETSGKNLKEYLVSQAIGIEIPKIKKGKKKIWSKEKIRSEVIKKIEESLLFEKVRNCPEWNKESVREFEDWIRKNKIRLPTSKELGDGLSTAISREYGSLLTAYEDIFGRSDSEVYIPLLDPRSEHYAPWLLVQVKWNRYIKEKEMHLDEWAVEKLRERYGSLEDVTRENIKEYRLLGLLDRVGNTLKGFIKKYEGIEIYRKRTKRKRERSRKIEFKIPEDDPLKEVEGYFCPECGSLLKRHGSYGWCKSCKITYKIRENIDQ